jgi:hypothetical protein
VHFLNRQYLSRIKSGGIALLVKNEISTYISVDESSKSKLVKFFTISHKLYGTSENNKDLKCGVVYLPPACSRYAHDNPFSEIQQEINRYCLNSDHILLFGDYNSRCGNLPDFVSLDGLISNIYDLQHLEDEEVEIITNFNSCNIPTVRKAKIHLLMTTVTS